MNIGIFTDTYYPQTNGVATSTRVLTEELQNRGHNVFVFAPDVRGITKMYCVFRVPSIRFLPIPTYRLALPYSHKAKKLIKNLNLDIIHTQTEFSLGLFGYYMSKILDIPNVHTYHTMYEDFIHYIKLKPKVAQVASRIICNRAKRIVVPSEKAKMP